MSRLLTVLRSVKRPHHRVRLTADFRMDLHWWHTFSNQYNGISLILEHSTSAADEIVATDACLTGCGAVYNNECFHRTFPEHLISDSNLHIHHLELLTIVVACRTWGSQWQRKRIIMNCDNAASVHAINGTRSKDTFLSTCVRELWFLSSQHHFEIQAVHIAGIDNRLPDLLSRWHLDSQYGVNFHEITAGKPLQEILIEDVAFDFHSPY